MDWVFLGFLVSVTETCTRTSGWDVLVLTTVPAIRKLPRDFNAGTGLATCAASGEDPASAPVASSTKARRVKNLLILNLPIHSPFAISGSVTWSFWPLVK